MAERLYFDVKRNKPNTVLLDGDDLRKVYRLSGHYSEADRLCMAKRHARMCYLLTAQNIDVICPTISMFDEVREWNRKKQKKYVEIFIEVSFSSLKKRSKLNLYSESSNKKNCYVVGKTVKAEIPKDPDLVLVNDGDTGIDLIYQQLRDYLNGRKF